MNDVSHTHVLHPIFFIEWCITHTYCIWFSYCAHVSLIEINQETVINIAYDGLKEMYYW